MQLPAAIVKGVARASGLGSALTGYHDDIRTQRLEDQLNEVLELVARHEIALSTRMDRESLDTVLIQWSDAIKKESRREKLGHLRKYLAGVFTYGVDESDLDARLRFLRALDDLSVLDCYVLEWLCRNDRPMAPKQLLEDVGPIEVYAAFQALSRHGLVGLEFKGSTVTTRNHSTTQDAARVTRLGKEFRDFCLEHTER
jgi:hypothetical protein